MSILTASILLSGVRLKSVRKTLGIVALFLTVGCLDVPAMNGIMDRIVPEPVLTYTTFEVWTGEGNFAPDPMGLVPGLKTKKSDGHTCLTVARMVSPVSWMPTSYHI